jgi:HPt (histidine-containing phosphotransfer) domain-containing protein
LRFWISRCFTLLELSIRIMHNGAGLAGRSSGQSPSRGAEMLENTIDSPGTVRQQVENAAKALFNADAALERLDGDQELFAMLITVFQQDSVLLFEQLSSGISSGNLSQVERAAHSLKGLAANFDAQEAAEVAYGIEAMARAGATSGLERRCHELHGQLEKLRNALAQWGA